MTDKAYTTADLGIFGVHPCFLRFFYDSPTIHNTCITHLYSSMGGERPVRRSSQLADQDTIGSDTADLPVANVWTSSIHLVPASQAVGDWPTFWLNTRERAEVLA